MKRNMVFLTFFIVFKLYALSSDDFIIQESNYPAVQREKIFLRQVWGEAIISDNLVKTESFENYEGGYKDVIIYYYENIEIVTAKFSNVPDPAYRVVVEIHITGPKYSTMNEITVGSRIETVFSKFGKPDINSSTRESMLVSVYNTEDLHESFRGSLFYFISFIHKNNIIEKIIVYYAFD